MGEVADRMRGGGDTGGGQHEFEVAATLIGSHVGSDFEKVAGQGGVAFGADAGALLDEFKDFGGDFACVEDRGLKAAVVFFDSLAEFLAAGLVLVVESLNLLECLWGETEFGCQPGEFRGEGVGGVGGPVMGVWVGRGEGRWGSERAGAEA